MSEKDEIGTLLGLLDSPFEFDPAAVAALVDMWAEPPDRARERFIFEALDRFRTAR